MLDKCWKLTTGQTEKYEIFPKYIITGPLEETFQSQMNRDLYYL